MGQKFLGVCLFNLTKQMLGSYVYNFADNRCRDLMFLTLLTSFCALEQSNSELELPFMHRHYILVMLISRKSSNATFCGLFCSCW